MSNRVPDSVSSRRYELATAWPVRCRNKVLNVCPQGELMVIERFGSLHKVQGPEFFTTIPFVNKISFRVDMRERTLGYPPQLAITKDNVSVHVSAVVFLQFKDAEKACYGAANPLTAVMELTKAAMRCAVGELELNHNQVRSVLEEPAANWGVVFTRHEVLDVRTDARISKARTRWRNY